MDFVAWWVSPLRNKSVDLQWHTFYQVLREVESNIVSYFNADNPFRSLVDFIFFSLW